MPVRGRRASVILTALSLAVLAGGTQPAFAWWGCDPGYTLQENGGTKVRCFKAASTQNQTPTCPPGTTRKQNVVGNQDRCRVAAGAFGADGPVLCGAGFTLDVEPGWDVCRKSVPAHEKAPTLNVP